MNFCCWIHIFFLSFFPYNTFIFILQIQLSFFSLIILSGWCHSTENRPLLPPAVKSECDSQKEGCREKEEVQKLEEKAEEDKQGERYVEEEEGKVRGEVKDVIWF